MFIFDPVWRALQTFELFIATHAILFCGEGWHIDLDGVRWHQEVQFIGQLTTPDYALYYVCCKLQFSQCKKKKKFKS